MENEVDNLKENAAEASAESLVELDEDQLKAFESIMSQIESNEIGSTDMSPDSEDSESAASSGDAPLSEQQVMEGNAPEESSDPPVDEEISENGLDADQLQAFESIMSQIENGEAGTGDAASEATEIEDIGGDGDASAELELIASGETLEDTPLSGQRETASGELAGSNNHSSGEEIEDISKDIADLLSNMDAQDDSPSLRENDAAIEPNIKEEVYGVEDKQTKEREVNPSTSSGEPTSDGPAASGQLDDVEKDVLLSEIHTEPSVSPENTKTEAFITTEAIPAKKHRRLPILLCVSALFLLSAAGAIYYGVKERVVASEIRKPAPEAEETLQANETPAAATAENVEMVDDGQKDLRRLANLIQSIDRLRDEIRLKQQEIEALRTYYEAGIEDELKALSNNLRSLDKKNATYENRLADERFQLGLQAIQRRDAYRKRLKKPSHQLVMISEELLFLSRKGAILSIMAGKTSDIDVEAFIEKTTNICSRHSENLSALNIDEGPVQKLSLGEIWKKVVARSKRETLAVDPDRQGVSVDNTEIWKAVCEGDFSQKDKLTALSTEAAECLAHWEGKDLYLNGLTTLSPEAARHLSNWEGEWLGLNGLKELSPQVASELSKWKGRVLSLNGLIRLSPKIVDILSHWQGDQIELINVQHMAHWENPKTKLFLSEEFQRQHFAKRE